MMMTAGGGQPVMMTAVGDVQQGAVNSNIAWAPPRQATGFRTSMEIVNPAEATKLAVATDLSVVECSAAQPGPSTPSTADEEWASKTEEDGVKHGKELLQLIKASSALKESAMGEPSGFEGAGADAGADSFDRCSASALRRRRRQKAASFNTSASGGASSEEQYAAGYQRRPMAAHDSHAYPRQEPSKWQKSEDHRCARLSAELEAGGERAAAAMMEMQGEVRRMSMESAGCRVVQLAFAALDKRSAEELVMELWGHVREAINSPHGNYVIQKVVELMPSSSARFVVEELRGQAAATARHRFGCRVICRLLEQSGCEDGTASLIDEVLEQAEDLCRHSFGHHVVQSILEHGLSRQRARIAEALGQDVRRNAKNRNASYVIEKSLTYCSPEDCAALSSALLSSPEEIAALAQNQFGAFVVRSLLRQPGAGGEAALEQLKMGAAQQNGQQVSRHLHRLLEENSAAAAAA
eukprot:gb/GFBE01041250.1/.p1 GENE.gb/GFBE01041250.1/~~gb/GFBE01041250.1/.p1  ORF type:complete len:467 (+),score=123.35 gb/GFBE01041250.1/:1-1401(+)